LKNKKLTAKKVCSLAINGISKLFKKKEKLAPDINTNKKVKRDKIFEESHR
jgi:hypothetical protein